MMDLPDNYESDHEVSKDHSKLLEAVAKLDKGQRVKNSKRTDPSIEVSEFHLVKSGITDKEAVEVDDLIKTLNNKPHYREIVKKFRSTKGKSKLLKKPLEKPQADRLKREIGYENAKKEVQRWDAIITRNRSAPFLSFPLKKTPFIEKTTTNDFVKRFRIQSELEKELEALEPQKIIEKVTVDEFPLTLQEILQRRRESAKFRAQQSYKEAKAFRQNKIKSKKFHRIQRKEKIKQQIKDFEKLQKTNPQAAIEKLEELDKIRAEERMSLRHKNTGKWAKNKQIRAKYDKDSRKILSQQLSISRDLTQKIHNNDDDDNDNDNDNDNNLNDNDNPWINSVKTESEIDNFISNYRKYWEEKNKNIENNKNENNDNKNNKNNNENNENIEIMNFNIPDGLNPVEEVIIEENKEKIKNKKVKKIKKIEKCKKLKLNEKIKKSKSKFTSEWSVETFPSIIANSRAPILEIDEIFDEVEEKVNKKAKKSVKKLKKILEKSDKLSKINENLKKPENNNFSDLSFKNKKLIPEINEEMNETISKSHEKLEKNENNILKNEKLNLKRSSEIDPTKFISVKPKHLKTQLPDDVIKAGEEELDDSEEDQHNIISEAFADDDIVDEFRNEKNEEIKKSQSDDINLHLPGWGTWCGKNIKENSVKKRRFILKFPKESQRKDENKGDVIIIENSNKKIKEHLVNELPYPFTSVSDYETSMRAPIGRNFVPENSFKRLTELSVKTKLGAIIEPMDDDVLINKNVKVIGKLLNNDKKSERKKKLNKQKKKSKNNKK